MLDNDIYMNNKVLVIGGNHYNPLGVIEALGQKGVMSDVIIMGACERSYILKSKYVDRGWICKSDEDVVSTIVDKFNDKQNKTVAIACNDYTACLLNDYYDALKEILILPGIEQQGVLKEWLNKGKMTEVAEELGMPIPPTWTSINHIIPANIEYPCITKPITSLKFGKSDFSICNNEDDLRAFLAKMAHSNVIQLQKHIDYEYEFQFMGCSLNGGEEVIIPGDTYIEKVTGFTNGTFMKYHKHKAEDASLMNKCKEFVQRTGYSGLFSIEFMHGKDGKDYFLEMNFRNDGNCAIVTASGTNLPYIWYLFCSKGDYRSELDRSYVTETYSLPEDVYFINMLLGKVTFRQWRRDMKKVKSYFTYFKGDSKPFWTLMWYTKKDIIKSALYGAFRRLKRVKGK